MNLNFLDRISRNTQLLNLMTIRPVSSKLFHATRHITNQVLALDNSANSPNRVIKFPSVFHKLCVKNSDICLQLENLSFLSELYQIIIHISFNYSHIHNPICSIDSSLMEPQMKYKTTLET